METLTTKVIMGVATCAIFGLPLTIQPATAMPYDGITPGSTTETALTTLLKRRRAIKVEDQRYVVGGEKWFIKLGFSPDGRTPGRVVLGVTIKPAMMSWDEFVGRYGEPDASFSKSTPSTRNKYIQCEYRQGLVACLTPTQPYRVLAYGFTRPGELFDSLWSAHYAIDEAAKGRYP